eukprot:UN02628
MMVAGGLLYIYLKPGQTSLLLLRILITLQIITGVGFSLLYFWKNDWVLYILCVILYSMLTSAAYPCVITLLLQHYENRVGAAIGWEYFFRISFSMGAFAIVDQVYEP